MRITWSFAALLPAILGLAGCGFQLRGADAGIGLMQGAFLQVRNAEHIDAELQRRTATGGVELVSTRAQAAFILDLRDERFYKRTLSISARSGKIAEYELEYKVQCALLDPDGESVLPAVPIQVKTDYVFSEENTPLSEFEQEQLRRRELVRRAATLVLARLRAAPSHHVRP